MKRILRELKEQMYIPLLFLILLIMSFCFEPIKDVFYGYYIIATSPSILITDYIAIAGIGSTLLNVATILLFNYLLLKKLKLKITGPVFAGIICIMGFSFFGKNIFNTLPIYLGIFLYAKAKKAPFRNFIITILFSTGISPLVSYAMFGFGFPLYIGIPFGIICGVIAGFLIPALASHTVLFHQGYNLFNTGFCLGIISLFFNATFKAIGLNVVTESYVSNDFHWVLFSILLLISIGSIIIAILQDHTVFLKYRNMLKRSGRLVSDYIRDFGRETVLLNFGFLGLLSTLIVIIFKIPLNGPVFGTILTIMGFASFGMHLKNVLPIFVGSLISIFISGKDFNSVSVIIAFFFSAGLAPIAGRYGFFTGVMAGMLHIIVSPMMIDFQGGFDLYNNGFAAGFVAAIIVVIAEAFHKRKDEHNVRN